MQRNNVANTTAGAGNMLEVVSAIGVSRGSYGKSSDFIYQCRVKC